MIQSTDILQRRLLATLAQAASTHPPSGWRELEPSEPNRRPAAAVLLEVAEARDRQAMAATLRETAERIRHRRENREGGEAALFSRTAELLEALDEPGEPGEDHLLGLHLWAELPPRTLNELRSPFKNLVPQQLPVAESWLTEAARILLRSRAKAWEDQARAKERGSEGGRQP